MFHYRLEHLSLWRCLPLPTGSRNSQPKVPVTGVGEGGEDNWERTKVAEGADSVQTRNELNFEFTKIEKSREYKGVWLTRDRSPHISPP